jgi:hypothetical protein
MANHHRGEASFTLDGRTIALRLTLGSLAELEDSLGAADLAALGERLGSGRLSARDIAAVLAAGYHGAGEPMEAVALSHRIPASALGVAAATALQLLAAAFGEADPGRPRPPQA